MCCVVQSNIIILMKLFRVFLVVFCVGTLRSQSLYFPPNSGNEWAKTLPQELNWCESEIEDLYRYLDSQETDAFILLKDGKIVLEKYFGTFTADSFHVWNSAGKTLTALTIGIAQQEGKLKLDSPSSTYLGKGWTSCSPDQEDRIKLIHQITMSTGLDDAVSNSDCTLPSCFLCITDAGSRWAYHNGPYTILDKVIQNATQQSLNQYVTNKILSPIGMSGRYFTIGDNNVFISKARSMARFGLLLLAKGMWADKAIMSDTSYFRKMTNSSQSINPSYGYLTWLNGKSFYMLPSTQFKFQGWLNPFAPEDMFAAIGKNGQLINIVPSQNLVFIRMGESGTSSGAVPITINNEIWRYINAFACNTSTSDYFNQAIRIAYLEEMLRIENRDNINLNIKLVDLNGKELQHLISDDSDILIQSAHRSGIYFLQVESAYGIMVRKLVF